MDFTKQVTSTGQIVDPMRQLYKQWKSVLDAENQIKYNDHAARSSFFYGRIPNFGIGVVEWDTKDRPILATGFNSWGYGEVGKSLIINADGEFMTPYISGPGDRERLAKITYGVLTPGYAYSTHYWKYGESGGIDNTTDPVVYISEKLMKGDYWRNVAPWMRLERDPKWGFQIAFSREGTDMHNGTPPNGRVITTQADWDKYAELRAKRLKRLVRADAIARGIITPRARTIPDEATAEARLQAEVQELLASMKITHAVPNHALQKEDA